MDDIDGELSQFALFALDHATNSVVPEGGPLVPFAMIQSGERPELHRFPGDLEEGQEHARQYVRQAPNLRLAVVAWDGYLTSGRRRVDAVFVEAFGNGEAESLIAAQRYRSVGFLRKRTEALEGPVLVARGRPLF